MNWILTAVLLIGLVELVARIPFREVALEISSVARRALHILGASSVSDHWKEKAMLAYARRLFIATMKLAGIMAGVGGVAVLGIQVLDLFGTGVSAFLISGTGTLFSAVVATFYFIARKHRV